MRPDLNGRWTGELIYGKNFGQLEHEAVFFTLDLQQQGDELVGLARDEDGIGIVPYESKVEGFVEQEQINFVKEQCFPVLFAPEHTQPLQEASFVGTYNASTGEYEGEWILLSDYVLLGNVFYEKENGGTWRMKKETPNRPGSGS